MQTGMEFLDSCLPPAVALAARRAAARGQVYELRLRAGLPVQLVAAYGRGWLKGDGSFGPPETALATTPGELEETLFLASGRSMQSAMADICKGFLPLPDGGRLGIAGTAASADGKVCAVHSVQALNFRFPAFVPEAADPVLRAVRFPASILIAGRPMSGKTTLLRALISRLGQGMKLAVLDERGELTPLPPGALSADLLTGYPKAESIGIAVRTLSPELMVCDELSPSEADAVLQALHSGVPLVATVHAGSFPELLKRPWVRRLLDAGAFDYLALIAGGKVERVVETDVLAADGGRREPLSGVGRDGPLDGRPAAGPGAGAGTAGTAVYPAGKPYFAAAADFSPDR